MRLFNDSKKLLLLKRIALFFSLSVMIMSLPMVSTQDDYIEFDVIPDNVYIGQSNLVEIIATDFEGLPIQGINLTFVSSIPGILTSQPDPVQTDADGVAQMSIYPQASGKLYLTIAQDIQYEDGQLNWTNAVITDTYLTSTSIHQMKISLSISPIYEGETLTVTVTSDTNALADVDVEFAETTVKTDSNGQATFTVPDPGVESAVYTVTAEKSGYLTAEKSIAVIKIWDVNIIAPSEAPAIGEEFSLTILAKGSPLPGAIVTFNGMTYTSGADGKLTINAPNKAGDYTVTAIYEDYESDEIEISIQSSKNFANNPIVGNDNTNMYIFFAIIGIILICSIILIRNKKKRNQCLKILIIANRNINFKMKKLRIPKQKIIMKLNS